MMKHISSTDAADGAVPSRLLMVSNFLSARGTSRGACEELADRLSHQGWDVITTSQQTRKIRRLADMLSTVWRRRRNYDVAQVDVYSGSAFVWAEAVCAMLRSLRKPYVLSLHGGGLPDFARTRKSRVSRLLRSAAAVTTPSRYLLTSMAPYRADLTLLPNSLDLQRYEFRCRTDPQPHLIWLRSIHEIYNPVQAVAVLSEIRQTHPGVTLEMVGPDKGDGSALAVKREAARLDVADRLTLTGVVAKVDVPKHLSAADVFLNTSNIDNTPISVIEAMATGLCVVSTNVGGIPYLVDDERDGLLSAPGDTQQMAKDVRRIFSDHQLAESLSTNARRKTESFDWSVTLPKWNDVLVQAYQRQTHDN